MADGWQTWQEMGRDAPLDTGARSRLDSQKQGQTNLVGSRQADQTEVAGRSVVGSQAGLGNRWANQA